MKEANIALAENGMTQASSQAKAILEYAYGEHYFECPDVPESVVLKSTQPISADKLAEAMGLQLKAEPNPATDWAVFNYTLADSNAEGVIKIMDSKGSFITSLSISGMQGQKVWDTRKLTAGVYFYTLNVSGFNKTGKIIISK